MPFFYLGRNESTHHRFTGVRRERYSPTSWFLEIWLRGRYVGLAR